MLDQHIIKTIQEAVAKAATKPGLPPHAPAIKAAFDCLSEDAQIHLVTVDDKQLIVIGEPGQICPTCHGSGRV